MGSTGRFPIFPSTQAILEGNTSPSCAAADTFNHAAAKGFIDLYGLSTKVWATNRRKMGVTDGEELL